MISARSQPRPMKNSTNSTHSSRFRIQALCDIILIRPSDDDAAPARSTPTRPRGAPPRTADARGRRLLWPGAAPLGSAVNQGPQGPSEGVLPRQVSREDPLRGEPDLTEREAR